MTNDWFFYDADGKLNGPLSADELRQRAEHGDVTPETRIRHQNGKEALAKNVKGLFTEVPAPPVKPPDPPAPPPLPPERVKKTTLDEIVKDTRSFWLYVVSVGILLLGLVAAGVIAWNSTPAVPDKEESERVVSRESETPEPASPRPARPDPVSLPPERPVANEGARQSSAQLKEVTENLRDLTEQLNSVARDMKARRTVKTTSPKQEKDNLRIGEQLFREGRLLCMDGEFEHADTKLTEAVSYDINEEKDEWRYFLFMARYRQEMMHAERDLASTRKFWEQVMQHGLDQDSPLPERLTGIAGGLSTKGLVAACLALSLMMESEGRGEIEEAIEHNSEVLELFPFDIEARYNRVTLYLKQGENIKAINDLAMVLDEEPNYSPALSIQASVLVAVGSFDAAIKAIDKAIKFAPDREYREEYQQEKRKILEWQKKRR